MSQVIGSKRELTNELWRLGFKCDLNEVWQLVDSLREADKILSQGVGDGLGSSHSILTVELRLPAKEGTLKVRIGVKNHTIYLSVMKVAPDYLVHEKIYDQLSEIDLDNEKVVIDHGVISVGG